MAEKKTKFIDDSKMNDFINKNWEAYQKAQKAQSKKPASGKPKKKVKRK